MANAVGKSVIALNYASVLNVRARSLSCCRLPRSARQPPTTAGNTVRATSVQRSDFSTADRESPRPDRAMPPKSVVREWMQYAVERSSHFDLRSVSRVLAPLHIDLPKLIPRYRNGWGFWAKDPPPPPPPVTNELEEQPADGGDVVELKTNETTERPDSGVLNSDGAVVAAAIVKPTKRDVKSTKRDAEAVARSCEREQHDFAGAMITAHESIGSFRPELTEEVERNDVKTSDKILQKDLVRQPFSGVVRRDPALPAGAASQTLVSQATVTANAAYGVAVTAVKQIASYLPSYGGGGGAPAVKADGGEVVKPVKDPSRAEQFLKRESAAAKRAIVAPAKKTPVARGLIDRRTRALVVCLREAKTATSQSYRLEELCQHLLQYPETQNVAVKDKLVPCLLQLRSSRDAALRESASEALALVGCIDPVRRHGIRVLTLDGGGTRGLIAIEIMKKLEEITQQRIHELFDYICGVSTGSLIGVMASTFQVPLIDTEQVYKEFSSQMFARNKLVGAGKLFMSHAYYDTELWEKILKENIGDRSFLETAKDPLCPKISAVSTLMNVSRVQNFLFRNYNLPAGRQSHYAGSISHHLWEAIRASSAAPGYYEEFQLGEHVHQDGGLLTNNPTAIAIHECQLLWPNESLQCVVSIGTGKHEKTTEELEPVSKSSSLKATVTKVIQSATDTEAVHTVLRDLLKPSTYFRFNPYMSEEFVLDEIREAKWDQMKQDTEMYCRKNQLQLQMAAQRLLEPRPSYKKASDWLKLQMTVKGL